jgi:hypothetical protein
VVWRSGDENLIVKYQVLREPVRFLFGLGRHDFAEGRARRSERRRRRFSWAAGKPSGRASVVRSWGLSTQQLETLSPPGSSKR